MEAIVLAGGLGTRLRQAVPDLPKPMAPVAGRPFLRYLLDQLASSGFERVVLAVGYRYEVIRDFFGSAYRGLELVYSCENEPLLTGGAIKEALRNCEGERVFVMNGDTYTRVEFGGMWASAALEQADLVLAVARQEAGHRYGSVILESPGAEVSGLTRVRGFLGGGRGRDGWINLGVYCMRRDLLDHMPHKFSFETDFMEQQLDERGLFACPQ